VQEGSSLRIGETISEDTGGRRERDSSDEKEERDPTRGFFLPELTTGTAISSCSASERVSLRTNRQILDSSVERTLDRGGRSFSRDQQQNELSGGINVTPKKLP